MKRKKLHINFLELKAAFLSLKCFCSTKTNIHIRLYLDSMVTVNYIDKMGGRIESLNSLTKDIWQWCIKRDIWLSVCHLPGKVNIEADRLSRSTNIDLEWKLNTKGFHEINSSCGPHDIDLFASRINHQLSRYISYLPDPNAEFVDACSLKWIHINGFAFPPVSIVRKVVQKLIAEETELT
jgi:hypothetical protein